MEYNNRAKVCGRWDICNFYWNNSG